MKFDFYHEWFLEGSDVRGQDCVLLQEKMSGRLLSAWRHEGDKERITRSQEMVTMVPEMGCFTFQQKFFSITIQSDTKDSILSSSTPEFKVS